MPHHHCTVIAFALLIVIDPAAGALAPSTGIRPYLVPQQQQPLHSSYYDESHDETTMVANSICDVEFEGPDLYGECLYIRAGHFSTVQRLVAYDLLLSGARNVFMLQANTTPLSRPNSLLES